MTKKYIIISLLSIIGFGLGVYCYLDYISPKSSEARRIKIAREMSLRRREIAEEMIKNGVPSQEAGYFIATGTYLPKNIDYCKRKGDYAANTQNSRMGPIIFPSKQYSFWEYEPKDTPLPKNYLRIIEEEFDIHKFQRIFLEKPPSENLINKYRQAYKNVRVLKVKTDVAAIHPKLFGSKDVIQGDSSNNRQCWTQQGGKKVIVFHQCLPPYDHSQLINPLHMVSDKVDRRFNHLSVLQILEPEDAKEMYGEYIITYFGETGCEDPTFTFIPYELNPSSKSYPTYYVIFSGERIEENYYNYNKAAIQAHYEVDINAPGYILLGEPFSY